jgi:hypothetical protein
MHNNNNIKIIIEGIYIVSFIENKKTKGLGPPPSPPPPQFITRETAKPATTTTNEKLSHLSLSLSNTLLTQASLRYFFSMLLLFYLSFIYFIIIIIIITVIIFKLLFFRHFLETPFFVFFKHKPTKSFFNVNVRSC